MKINDLSIYSRPVLFERENSDYVYTILGSCFGIIYKNKYMLITAKHVLDNHSDADISIPYFAGSSEFLPISDILTVEHDKEFNDTYQFDIAIMNLNINLLTKNKDFNDKTFLKISNCLHDISTFNHAIVFGFPMTNQNVDYDNSHIKLQRKLLGINNIQDSSYNNCFIFDVVDKNEEPHLSGFSGSMVFGFKKIDDKQAYCLIGMHILEKYFISTIQILNAVEEAYKKL